MPVVVDTSVTLAWLLPDEQSADADEVLARIISSNDTMIAPQLWVQETANVVVSAHRRGRLSEAQASRCLELQSALPLRIDERPVDQSALVAASLRHGLSVYDAAYLLLAERLGLPLATLDRRLADAAAAAGIEVLPDMGAEARR
ncbi:type II toxin-antitoxin system VapC family toxin [Microbacterium invictum]|uniref:Ribonuclease VapC n=1 Tax=Microbacterium invictum TaxID=515415 RepID=A0AA40SR25_9MICO|nr:MULTISPECIES: type II toxin-antitoxin system VapC family toxin [Microbacterium]MBB4140860.1 putative nucleic acid-binding protein [Microbacterium invictum]